MDRLALHHWSRGGFAVLRELCGHDEDSVDDTTTSSAVALVDRLLVDAHGVTHGVAPGVAPGVTPGCAAELCAADRDLLLTAMYLRAYGDAIESTVRCASCGEPFDLDFSLRALVDSLGPPSELPAARQPDGTWLLPDRRRFRLPTGADELAILQVASANAERELLRLCMLDGSSADDPEVALEAMRQVAPIVDLEVDAQCPECRHTQPVHFDVQSYLLSRLLGERRQRAHEVHRIARAYGWSRRDILDMTRSQRQTHVELIDREGSARWRTT